MMAQAAQRGDRRLQDILDKHLADPDAVAIRGRNGQEAHPSTQVLRRGQTGISRSSRVFLSPRSSG